MAYRVNGQASESGISAGDPGGGSEDEIEALRKENASLASKVQELTTENERLVRENDRLRVENNELIEDNRHADKQPLSSAQSSYNGGNGQLSGYTQLTSHVLGGAPDKKGPGRKQQNTRRKKRK